MDNRCNDPVVWNDWHPIAGLDSLHGGAVATTTLLGIPVAAARLPNGDFAAWDNSTRNLRQGERPRSFDSVRALPAIARYDHLWTCLGEPARALFDIAEAGESDRRCCTAGAFGVHVGGLRAIENFLDMAHFPFVHTGILGAEPDTEVLDYDVEVTADDEILVTNCRFRQPQAALNAVGAIEARYVYRVPRPFSAILYKTNAPNPGRNDVIAMFVQPVSEEECVAHQWLCMLDTESTDAALRRFQQTIFGQDKPILENQRPKRLPLGPRAELPGRADTSSVAYRRWLRAKNMTYGVIGA